MAIAGAIEDFPLKEIMQIISFSRRNGTLHVKGEKGKAQIVFKMGAVVQAVAPISRADIGTLALRHGLITQAALDAAVATQKAQPEEERRALGQILLSQGSLTHADLQRIVQEQIMLALRELIMWTTGSFVFEVHKVTAPDSISLTLPEMTLEQGLDVQRLLLEAMKFFSDRAREQQIEAARSPQAAEAEPSASADFERAFPETAEGSRLRPVIYHQPGPFRDALVGRLAQEGLHVDAADDPETAVAIALEHRDEGHVPILLVEMAPSRPAADGARPLERSLTSAAHVPVILLAEPGLEEVRERAFALGARHILAKPVRAQGSDAEYARAIEEFAVDVAFMCKGVQPEAEIEQRLEPPEAEEALDESLAGLPEDVRDFLRMLRSEDAASVTLKLLGLVAARYPRSVLLYLKAGSLLVKGAYGTTMRGTKVYDLIKNMHLDVRQCPGFAMAFETTEPRVLKVGPHVGQIPDLIGPPSSGECLVIPIMCHYRPVGSIYADTGASGEPIGGLDMFRELCHRVSEILGETVLRKRGKRYLDEGTGSFRSPHT